MKTADLHVHTHYSDGIHSIEEVLQQARAAGIKTIALTDHNWPHNVKEKVALAKKFQIESIEGIEISARYNDTSVHILGYSKNFDVKKLKAGINPQIKGHTERVKKIIANINSSGIASINLDDITKNYKGAIGNFPVMIELAKQTNRPISSIKPLYKEFTVEYGKWHFTPEQAIKLIMKTGGIAIWAHPALYIRDNGADKFDNLFKVLLRAGITGLEASHSDQTEDEEKFIIKLCQENGLLMTGGSDFHGLAVSPLRPLGKKGIDADQLAKLLEKLDSLDS